MAAFIIALAFITAAYLYQFEHLVRQHLMSLGAANRID